MLDIVIEWHSLEFVLVNLKKGWKFIIIKVRKKSNEKGKNYYYLNYPYWSVSKKDGIADRRVKKNYIIWKRSKLYVENYLVLQKGI